MADGPVLSMMGDHFRRLLRRAIGQQTEAPAAAASKGEGPLLLRRSSGLRELWKTIQGGEGLQILDLGPASQANVTFITDLGYKLYTADLLQSLLVVAKDKQDDEDGSQAEVEEFFRDNLNYPEAQFDGILCWDVFDFLADPLIKPLVERLHHILKPGGILLSFFHTARAGQQVPIYQYRIRAEDSLQMTGRRMAQLVRHFNNRTIENVFRDFSSLKFYLARDNLREVISIR